ncbi:MAG: hypothetical protein NTV87_02610 [Ignavibacteriae bacterium]|jgi:hypothetical protein|nr:hypothetical protein [Ignavibacteriota bacterium]
MNNYTSKSQIEVWEWKESLYEEIKNVPVNKRLEYLSNKSKDMIKTIMKNKKSVYRNSINTESPIVADSESL